jgi:hypothetical protein
MRVPKRSKLSLVNQKEAEENLPSASIYNDGLPERRDGEHCDAFEARLNAHIASVMERMDNAASSMRSTILVAFIRHLSQGNPPSTFFYKDKDGLTLCDFLLVEQWRKQEVKEYMALRKQIELAKRQCEARWADHLANMSAGRAGGNIKAMELYMKRFFNWDTDVTGQEEAKAACEMFRSITAKFTKTEVIDL